ncbi:triosephosphate isomerase [Candidatus Uhrbacteria bacterium]|nr:triosephosphate isomerase [Candidatus Uhrbacteria bacterium]
MIRKSLIIANWKMKLSPREAFSLTRSIVPYIRVAAGARSRNSFVICPSFESLSCVGMLLKKTPIALGAQDCFWEQSGAYTGEVSPTALKESGCSYVLVGHSERRLYCSESDSMIAKKMAAACETPRLQPILCIGESLAIRKKGTYRSYIQKQLEAGIALIPRTKRVQFCVAYEPLWAISTMGIGLPIGPEHCAEVTTWIKTLLSQKLPGAHVRIIYGGSVDSENVMPFLQRGVSDGVLIGGASLTVRSFKKILTVLNQ